MKSEGGNVVGFEELVWPGLLVVCNGVERVYAGMHASWFLKKKKKERKRKSELHAGRKREGNTVRPGGILKAISISKSFDSRRQSAVNENGA